MRRWQGPVARFLARLVGLDAAVADLTWPVLLTTHRAVGFPGREAKPAAP